MAGSGTKEDPWLITTGAELATVLRSKDTSGYYRATGHLSTSIADGGVAVDIALTYKCKVIDAQGYGLTVTLSDVVTTRAVIAGVMFVNCFLYLQSITKQVSSSQNRPFVNCFFTDCLLRLAGHDAAFYYFGRNAAGFSALEAKEFRRLVVIDSSLASSVTYNSTETLEGTTFVDVYKWTSATGSWYTRITTPPSLAAIDALTSGRFTEAGWYDALFGSIQLARPFDGNVINFVISTLVDGVPLARELMYESGGQSYVLGVSDENGLLDLSLLVKRFLTLRIVATESYALDRLQNGNYARPGKYYLPPVDNGLRYQSSGTTLLSNLESVNFGTAPIVIGNSTFTPTPVYPEMASARTTFLTGGAQQIITLDTADLGGGGGGPVLEGDPAYLDGVVEEIHPMLGTLRPLANAEVVVVELRADQSYAALGRALTSLIGEFRVNTDVYGGGDVFAFAVDFPGFIWQPAMELELGARVRPTVNNGYVYEIVAAGIAGGAEPEWWSDEGDGTEGSIGSATAKARPYYQPQAHGPLKMTFVE